jgi:hypothetical protein
MRNEEILKRTEEGMKESNKVLIRELIHDLEEKGIHPAWAIDGEVKKLRIIDESELQDFEKELKEFGLEKSDFCLLEEDVSETSEAPYPLNGNVILIHKKTAKIKTYKARNNSAWVVDFHRDLQSNFFTN